MRAGLTDFAASLGDPQGIAFGPDGSLYLADGRGGRLLRFVAPAPPVVTVPEFTAQAALTATGTTVAGARVDVFANDTTVPASAVADASGAFAVPLTVPPNAVSTLDAYATTHAGDGLTSRAATVSSRHDDLAPSLTFEAPPHGAHVRATVAVAARASDDGSAVAAVTLLVDGQALAGTLTPAPPATALTATAGWATEGTGDGGHRRRTARADGDGG